MAMKPIMINNVVLTFLLIAAVGILAALGLGAFFALKPKFESQADKRLRLESLHINEKANDSSAVVTPEILVYFPTKPHSNLSVDVPLYRTDEHDDSNAVSSTDATAALTADRNANVSPNALWEPPGNGGNLTDINTHRPHLGPPAPVSAPGSNAPGTTDPQQWDRIVWPVAVPGNPWASSVEEVNIHEHTEPPPVVVDRPNSPPKTNPTTFETAAETRQKDLSAHGKVVGISIHKGKLYAPSHTDGTIVVLETPSLNTIEELHCPGCQIYDLAIMSNDSLALVHGNQKKLTKMSASGQIVKQIELDYVTKGVAVSQNDDIFVLARSHDKLYTYDRDLVPLGSVMIPNKGPGDCNFIAINASDVMFVSCESSVFVFNLQGQLLTNLYPPIGSTYSVGLAVDDRGRILVNRRATGVVDIYKKDGTFEETLGVNPSVLWSDIAVADGYLYVVEYITGVIQVFMYDYPQTSS